MCIKKIVKLLPFTTLALISILNADSALEQANQVRRDSQEFNQELQQRDQLNRSFLEQNYENQQFNNEINSQDQLEVTPPAPLWNDQPN